MSWWMTCSNRHIAEGGNLGLQRQRSAQATNTMDIVPTQCAGLDVHKKTVVVVHRYPFPVANSDPHSLTLFVLSDHSLLAAESPGAQSLFDIDSASASACVRTTAGHRVLR
jgi:hypothetical protein